MNRNDAMKLVQDHVKNEALIRHMVAVEAAMGHYAQKFDEDEHTWRLVGLLHDFDYERFPEPPDHTRKGAEILREHGVDEIVIGAILSHADWNLDDFPRDTLLRRTLFAVDELCGFIYAVALMRPDRMNGLKAKSVKKKLKQKSFAAAVSRDDIVNGAESLGIPIDEHIDECIQAMTSVVDALGLPNAQTTHDE
jgi:putative nucleotidyltransferase with HDIG domain